MAIITGTSGNNNIDGTSGSDIIFGLGGNDVINSGAGNDLIDAGAGNDTVNAGTGNDTVDGGAGDDRLDGGAGNDVLYGGTGNDTLVYTLSENSGAKDLYLGGSGTDTLELRLTQAQYNSYQSQITAYKNLLLHPVLDGTFIFCFNSSTTLAVSGLEKLKIVITDATVNGAPVNTVPVAQAVNEDTLLAFTGSKTISVNDVDGNLAKTQLSVSHGILNVTLASGASISAGANGTGSLTINGTQAQINATLATLSYQGALNYNGSDTLTVVSTDSASTPLSDTDTIAITVTAVDDASALTPDFNTVTEDNPAVGNVLTNDSDVDNALSVASFKVTGDATVYNAGQTATITGVGTLLINGDGTYTFTPDANWNGVVPEATYTTNTGSSSTLNITVTAVDDASELLADTNSVAEDTIANGNVLTNDSDVDNALSVASFKVTGDATVYNAGQTATITGVGTLLINGDGTYTFTPDANWNGVVPQATYTTNTGSSSTLDITVTAKNDAPVNSVPDAQTVSEDTDLVFSTANGNAITVSDVDAGNNIIEVTLTATNGILSFSVGNITTTVPNTSFNGSDQIQLDIKTKINDINNSGSAALNTVNNTTNNSTALSAPALTVTGEGTNVLVLTGAIADINSKLDGILFTPNTNFSGSAQIQVDTNDQGNSGFGGQLTDSDTIAITIKSVNDASVNIVPITTQDAFKNVALIFSSANGNAIFISDVDAGVNQMEVTLTGTNGLITLGSIAGLSFVSGDGTSDTSITFTGTMTDINTALNGMSFTPTTEGTANLQITTNDQGYTGSGGPLSDSDTIAITVALPALFHDDANNPDIVNFNNISVGQYDPASYYNALAGDDQVTLPSLANAPADYNFANTFNGGDGNDIISGGDGNDIMTGGAGNDIMTGGAGNDTFNVDSGNDTINDLSNSDVLNVSAGVTANAIVTAAFTATAATQNFGIANLFSYGQNDVDLSLASGPNGYNVTDNIASSAHFTGSVFNDTLTGLGGETMTGGSGNDIFNVNGGFVNITDLSGSDVLAVNSSTANATVTAAFTATNATHNSGTANLSSNGQDVDLSLASGPNGYNVTNTGGSATFTGSAFNDQLIGGFGDDIIDGGVGNDTIDGGAGNVNDTLIGGAGINTLSYASLTSLSGQTVNLSNNTSFGGGGNDSISGFENIIGSNFSDILTGTLGANIIDGGAGNDTINGNGGIGDILIGGMGADILNAGGGADQFRYKSPTESASFTSSGTGADTINNFNAVSDQLWFKQGLGGFINNGSAGFDTVSGGNIASANPNAHFIYDITNNKLYYDANAGAHNLNPNDTQIIVNFGGIQNEANFTATDIHFF